MEPQDILNVFSHPEHANVYILGCMARRVTIYSQQCRAFNLAWALSESGTLPPQAHVGIVGGGIGGMTLAAALLLLNYEVTLFEKEDELVHLQRGCSTRFVHPRIYDWPRPYALTGKTDFPCLNWTAATAESVVEQLEAGWASFANHERIHLRLGTTVSRFQPESRPRLIISEPGFDSVQFDAVVLAVGFGSDSHADRISSSRSYWDVDSLHQGKRDWRSDQPAQRFLVSGCGDGGLVDVLRLRLRNFSHPNFVKALQQCTGIEKLEQRLIEIEDSAFDPRNSRDPSQYLHDAYANLKVPPAVLELVKKNLKRNVVVVLNGKGPTPMSTTSSLLNRFAVFLVSRFAGFKYQRGEFSAGAVEPRAGKFIVRCSTTPSLDGEYDAVVIRHGPSSVIRTFDEQLTTASARLIDGTVKAQWPPHAFRVLPDRHARQKEKKASLGAAWFSLNERVKRCAFYRPLKKRLQQVGEEIALHHAATSRLHGSEEASQLLDKVIWGGFYSGQGRLEKALLQFQNGEFDETAKTLKRAVNTRDKDVADNARILLAFLNLTRPSIETIPIVTKALWASPREQVRLSLIRGLLALDQSNLAQAESEWNLVKQTSEETLPGIYPYVELCTLHERFFVNVFTNPAFGDLACLRKRVHEQLITPLRDAGLHGLQCFLYQCSLITIQRSSIIDGFCKLGADAKWKRSPQAEDLLERFKLLTELLQPDRGRSRTNKRPG